MLLSKNQKRFFQVVRFLSFTIIGILTIVKADLHGYFLLGAAITTVVNYLSAHVEFNEFLHNREPAICRLFLRTRGRAFSLKAFRSMLCSVTAEFVSAAQRWPAQGACPGRRAGA